MSAISSSVAAGPVALPPVSASGNSWAFTRTTVNGVSAHAGAWGTAAAGPVSVAGDVRTAARLGETASVSASLKGDVVVGAAHVGGAANGAATLGLDGATATARVNGAASLGDLASASGKLGGSARVDGSGLAVGASVAADVRLGSLVASAHAGLDVQVDASFPFVHVNGSLSAHVGNQPTAADAVAAQG